MEGKEHKWWKRTPSLPCLIGGKKSNILQVTIIMYISFDSLKFISFPAEIAKTSPATFWKQKRNKSTKT